MRWFCGIAWSEHLNDVALVDEAGRVCARARVTESVDGFTQLVRVLVEHAGPDAAGLVAVAMETDRGLLVAALRGAGFTVYAINPKPVDRYLDRFRVSGTKSDAGDARVLADILRTDADRHRPTGRLGRRVLDGLVDGSITI